MAVPAAHCDECDRTSEAVGCGRGARASTTRRGGDTLAVVSLRKEQITMGWVGLEPTTNALKGRCSTIELPTPRERPL